MTADGEALRRRLYRPGAEAADVAAYLAAGASSTVASAAPPPVAAPPRRSMRGVLVAAGLLAVLTGSALTGAVLVGRAAPATAGRPAAAPPASVAAPAPLPTSPVDPAVRAAFLRRLASGDDAGLAGWWGAGPALVEAHGAGSATLPIPVARSGRAGHLAVILVLGADGGATWTTARFVIHDDRTIHLAPTATASGGLHAGIPTAARVDYPAGARPQRLVLQVPAGTRWGAAVVDVVDNGPQRPDS